MNTEQKIIELEKRVATLEKFYTLFRTSNKSTPASQGPTIEEVAKFITGQTTMPPEAIQDKTDPPVWLRPNDTAGSDPANIASTTPATNSDPAGQ